MNKKMILAIVALVVVVGVFAGVYFLTRPQAQEGVKTITVEVVHADGKTNSYTIQTDAETLAEAMNKKGLLGEDVDGLYNTIDGETVDYNANQSWWKLIVNGTEAVEGANTIVIVDGGNYRWEYTIGW